MRRVVVLAVILVALCAVPVLAQPPSGQLPLDANGLVDLNSPALAREIAAMQAEIKANGWTFKVGINPAMRYNLNQLCGRREELLPPEAFNHLAATAAAKAKPPKNTPTPSPDAGPRPRPQLRRYLHAAQGPGGVRELLGVRDDRRGRDGGARRARGRLSGLVSGDVITASASDPDMSEQYVLSCNPDGYSCAGGNNALAFLVAATGCDRRGLLPLPGGGPGVQLLCGPGPGGSSRAGPT